VTDPSGSGRNPDKARRTWAGLTVMVDEDRWAMLADLLVELASDESTEVVAEEAIGFLLGRGRVVALTEALRTRQGLPLLLRLFEVEVGVRLWQIRSYEIEALRAELDQTGRRDLWLWATALAAEHYMWLGDLSAFTIASAALAAADLDDERLFARIGRGKLRRLLAIGGLYLSSGTEDSSSSDIRAAALAEFEAAGCTDEIVATEVMYSIALSMMRRQDADAQVPSVRRAAESLGELGSDRYGDALLCWAWLATLAWDLPATATALAEFDEFEGRRPASLVEMRELLGLALDIVSGTATHFELLMRLRHLAARRLWPTVLLEGMSLYVVGLLLDTGITDLVHEVGPELLDEQGIGHVTHMDRLTVRARMRILEKPGTDAVDEFEAVLDQVEARGPARMAAVVALRGAADCGRSGLPDAAGRLLERGSSALPAEGDLTARELHYLELARSLASG